MIYHQNHQGHSFFHNLVVKHCASGMYMELMEAYPNAKVLLNVRDPEKWYDARQNSGLLGLGGSLGGSDFGVLGF